MVLTASPRSAHFELKTKTKAKAHFEVLGGCTKIFVDSFFLASSSKAKMRITLLAVSLVGALAFAPPPTDMLRVNLRRALAAKAAPGEDSSHEPFAASTDRRDFAASAVGAAALFLRVASVDASGGALAGKNTERAMKVRYNKRIKKAVESFAAMAPAIAVGGEGRASPSVVAWFGVGKDGKDAVWGDFQVTVIREFVRASIFIYFKSALKNADHLNLPPPTPPHLNPLLRFRDGWIPAGQRLPPQPDNEVRARPRGPRRAEQTVNSASESPSEHPSVRAQKISSREAAVTRGKELVRERG